MAMVRFHTLFKSLWKQEKGGESQAPVGATVRRFGIVTRANLKGDLLVSYARQFTDRRDDGDRPLFRLPVIGRLREQGVRHCLWRGVGDERLEKGGADLLSVAWVIHSPNVICERAIGPAVLLPQGDGCRPQSPLFALERVLSGRGQQENWPKTGNPATLGRFLGRKEKWVYAESCGSILNTDQDNLLFSRA